MLRPEETETKEALTITVWGERSSSSSRQVGQGEHSGWSKLQKESLEVDKEVVRDQQV